MIRSHGRVQKSGENYFSTIHEMDYIQIGYNFRMPTMCAALGIAQLEKIDQLIDLRRQRGKYYDELLKNNMDIQILPELEGQKTVYQLYSVLVNDFNKRDALQEYLKEREIYILERYGRNAEGLHRRIRDNFNLCRMVENKLFNRIYWR